MTTSLKLILFNIIVGILVISIFYIHGFASGYGSAGNHLKQEEIFFSGSVVFHLIINLFFIYRYIRISPINISLSTLLIISFYLIEAWRFGYFV
jgi:hypothetical protein